MNDDYAEITAIVAKFAERIDTHDWAGIGELFSHLTYTSPGIDYSVRGPAELAAMKPSAIIVNVWYTRALFIGAVCCHAGVAAVRSITEVVLNEGPAALMSTPPPL